MIGTRLYKRSCLVVCKRAWLRDLLLMAWFQAWKQLSHAFFCTSHDFGLQAYPPNLLQGFTHRSRPWCHGQWSSPNCSPNLVFPAQAASLHTTSWHWKCSHHGPHARKNMRPVGQQKQGPSCASHGEKHLMSDGPVWSVHVHRMSGMTFKDGATKFMTPSCND